MRRVCAIGLRHEGLAIVVEVPVIRQRFRWGAGIRSRAMEGSGIALVDGLAWPSMGRRGHIIDRDSQHTDAEAAIAISDPQRHLIGAWLDEWVAGIGTERLDHEVLAVVV